jgi:hypothetical protein
MILLASLVLSAATVTTIDGPSAPPQGSPAGYSMPVMDECGRAEATASVRPRDAMAHLLVQFGIERSQSFRDLLEDLYRARMIVYVEVGQDAERTLGGSLRFIAAEGCFRLVMATVESGTTSLGTAQGNLVALTAILGHELQHAREVAEESSIRSVAAFDHHFRTVGIRLGRNSVDTEAARRIGRVVEREVRGLARVPGLAATATVKGETQ